MTERVVKVPDVGEGIAEAELVEWHVAVGERVEADAPLAEVMTDKATVEIPSPVAGTVTWRAGDPGEVLAVGSELVKIAMGDGEVAAAEPEPEPQPEVETSPEPESGQPDRKPEPTAPKERETEPAPRERVPHHDVGARPQAAPAIRLRAREAGVDLRLVPGTGPAGRVTHADLDGYLTDTTTGRAPARARVAADDTVSDIKLIGLRKRIAQRMAEANAHIPHITYVDEVDLTLLQELRESLNGDATDGGRPKLTILPFLVGAIVEAVGAHPQCNARFDDQPDGTGVLHVHSGVHVGIATQTPNGLLVPVVRHAETRDLFECAAEIERLAGAARDGSATADALSGSTITITSLGAFGGIVTTPIINRPEVAIVGVNKLQTKPVWDGAAFVPRQVLNLSSSFDHRIIDGWDAAQFVQRIKRRLEAPGELLLSAERTRG